MKEGTDAGRCACFYSDHCIIDDEWVRVESQNLFDVVHSILRIFAGDYERQVLLQPWLYEQFEVNHCIVVASNMLCALLAHLFIWG